MFLKVFCVAFSLSLCFGYENDESDLQYELLSMEEYDRDLVPVDFPESEDDDDLKELPDDANLRESPADDGVSFAGPVKAKGTVSVTATFGNAPNLNHPQISTTNPVWYPTLYPQHILPPIPYVLPMPIPFPQSPFLPIFTPGIGFPFPKDYLKNSQKEAKIDAEKNLSYKESREGNEVKSLQVNLQREMKSENEENSSKLNPETVIKSPNEENLSKFNPQKEMKSKNEEDSSELNSQTEMKSGNEDDFSKLNPQTKMKSANEEDFSKLNPQTEMTSSNEKSSLKLNPIEFRSSENYFLQLTPLIEIELPVSNDISNTDPCDENLSSSLPFIDEDFTDYEEIKDSNLPENDGKLGGPESPSGVTFAGYVPAHGSIHIAARF